MKFVFTDKFKKLYEDLPLEVRKKLAKQLNFLQNNLSHPSLHAKKIKGHFNIWEARIDYHYRFTFNLEKDTVILRAIGIHDEALNNP